ncbi:MAG TPA: PIG-L family deacetylase [Acidimicrobiia bacterium]|nr:PIG-L family deacetylase [Acidimicrobiia bacterium]
MAYTLVVFHAHPDDEAIATGGVMAQAHAQGHRVVLVVATRGELGEYDPAILEPGETLADRRVAETQAAAKVLGVDRVEFLGYRDSGMAGEDSNHATGAFANADLEEAAQKLAALLVGEHADVLTVYDEFGNYGHPDHIQVHRVGVRAAEIAQTTVVLEATMNRDHLLRLMEMIPDGLDDVSEEERPTPEDIEHLGMPESALTTAVDVRDFVELKRAAMAAHASQISDASFFLQMPIDAFRESFGYEWFIRRGAEPGLRESSLFETLSPRP